MSLRTLALAAGLATVTASGAGTLYAFSIRSIADDDHEQAQVLSYDPVTGAEKWRGSHFPFAASDSSSLDCFIGWQSSPATFYVTSGVQPEILTVDAASGLVTRRVPLAEQRFVLGFSYDTRAGAAVGVFANYSGPPDAFLARVNASTGGLQALDAKLPYARLLPCEATLVPEHEWLIFLNADGDMDDAPDTWVVVDVSAAGAGALIFSGNWSFAKNGRINAFVPLPDSCVGARAW